MLTIDGTLGEGGGQILRTSLALAAVTGKAFRIENIRGKRKRPGLMRQHLAAVQAAAAVCGASLSGAELGSSLLSFEPRAITHGDYNFAVGSAGSATLVFQTILPPLLMAAGKSRIVFEGGTHNMLAPPFDFIAQTFLPLLQRMGARVSAVLTRPGFYPAGGGKFEVVIEGGVPLTPLELLERGAVERVIVRAIVSRIPGHIAERETKVLARALAHLPLEVETGQVDSPGPGNYTSVTVQSAAVVETFSAFGEVGVRAEKLAYRLAGQVRHYLEHEVPVAEHLADQLLIACALAGGGSYRTLTPSSHTMTNAEVISMFLPARVEVLDGVLRVRSLARSSILTR